MSQEVASFVNESIKNSLMAAIRELCLHRPFHQEYFIADFLERHAIALEKAAIRKEVRDGELAALPAPVPEENVEEIVLRQIAPYTDLLDVIIAWKSASGPQLGSILPKIADFMHANIFGARTSYVGKLVDGYNKSIEYVHVCGSPSTLPPLMEGKGVTWSLWSDPAPIYIEDVLFDRRVEFLVSYPRSGSLFLLRASSDHVLGIDASEGVDKVLRDFLEFIVARL